ncbi:MAG: hypothetical protein NTV86_08115 [Planctomycetota bacterium]|nr:hypothetical protein [Planctomycetota bacterium]
METRTLVPTDLPTPDARLSEPRLGAGQIAAFAVIASALALLLGGYAYGESDQVDHLDHVYRALDPSFCPGDLTADCSERFSPRTYYVAMLKPLCRVAPIHVVFLCLAFAGEVLLCLLTYYAALSLFRRCHRTAMIACCLVLSSVNPVPGMAGADLSLHVFVPYSLAAPLGLLALWAAVSGRPLLCVGVAIPAMLIQPQVGFPPALIGLAAAVISSLLPRRAPGSGKELVSSLAATGALGLGFWFFWVAPFGKSIPDDELLSLIRFRMPHHYFPDHFGPGEWVSIACILGAFALSYRRWRPDAPGPAMSNRLILVVAIVLVSWVAAFVFTVLIPVRLVYSAQSWRLAFVPRWLTLLLVANTCRQFLASRAVSGAAPWLLLVGAGLIQSVLLLAGQLLEPIHRRLVPRIPPMAAAILTLLPVAAAVLLVAWSREVHLLAGVLSTLALTYWVTGSLASRATRRLAAAGVCVALVAALACLAGRRLNTLFPVAWGGEIHAPADADQDEAAQWAGRNTPPEALFLAPPDFGPFRLEARRSLVVDFKAWPMQDWGMRQWKARIDACYGPVTRAGFPGLKQMKEGFRHVTDDRIGELARQFRCTFAVLYKETPSLLPVVHENAGYKVVLVNPAP